MSRRRQSRRQYARAEVNWPVDVENSKVRLKGSITNISRGGALIYLKEKLDIHDQIRLGIEIPEYEDVIFAKGEVVRSFAVESGHNSGSFCVGVKFTEISNEDLRYFTGNLAEEWREDYQESTLYPPQKSYLKPAVYGIVIFFLTAIATYVFKSDNSDRIGREQIIELSDRIIALEDQLTASKSIESAIVNLENRFHEVQAQLVAIQRNSESFVTIDNLQIQTKYFENEIVELKNKIELSNLPEIKIVSRNEKNSDFVYHVVEKGDNLYRIGLIYKIHVDKIKELNRISKNDSIRPGQEIIVGWK